MDDQEKPLPVSDVTQDAFKAEPETQDDIKPSILSDAAVRSATATDSTDWTIALQQVTDKALHFLSTASNETLGACLVGLGATTYFVLGRVGLVVIGIAGGVVLHATWDASSGRSGDGGGNLSRRKEAGIEVARRLLDLRKSNGGKSEQDKEDSKVCANQQLDFTRFEPETAKALDNFANAVIKDYVHYWYDPTLPGELSFPASCKRTFVAFLLSLSGHLERKRPADAFLDFVTNASSIIIVFLNELSAALNASPNAAAEDAVATYLRLKPDSNLTHILDVKYQDSKLKAVAEDTIEAYLDPKAYNCPPLHSFLREILAHLVLGATVTLCSRPEWINEWIVYGLEESETTKEVMELVDAGVEGRQINAIPPKTDGDRASKAVASQKEEESRSELVHKRQISRAEEAMDEATKEAQRLTQLMIEEDQRQSHEGRGSLATASSSGEDMSDLSGTHGALTPTSSDSDRDHQERSVYATDASSITSPTRSATDPRPVTPTLKQPFTTFDQLLPTAQPTALSESPVRAGKEQPQFTLHKAIISIFDDSVPGDRSSIKSKPTVDYMIQIEPSSSAYPGWMIPRKYADFEVLHEVLRRISVITGAKFTESHSDLPRWRGNTKAALRMDLEKYLTAAVRFPTLAESEGMKRFLEKENATTRSPGEKGKPFGWPTPETFGKFGGNMIDVLAKAPKDVAGGVAGGGKAFFGNVAGLVGGKRPGAALSAVPQPSAAQAARPEHKSNPSMGQAFMTDTYLGSMTSAKQSEESVRSMSTTSLERTGSTATMSSARSSRRAQVPSQRTSGESSRPASIISPAAQPVPREVAAAVEETFNLPPPPSDITDDYGSPARPARASVDTFRSSNLDQSITASADLERPLPATPAPELSTPPKPKTKPPITEQETAVAVELIFAVITELYTLSSAWQIRRTLLAAAKTFLLRPGNPQLASIRDLLQTSLLDSNLSDAGMAAHLQKLRENALPTAEELEIWARDYPPKSDEEKEALRVKARRLLVQNGMPQALTSVMGAAASGEALGKVFDCLQIPEVSRGLIFGLFLQALKVMTH
ncbi:hypothetical protein B0A48_12273 [Cryoendolithus antarcticus]|uniref:PXA domain-containing protein n=1 Tax=Cryoendolithus antarcticus TaxID=1507870 RepID=A0A1V8SRU9_9PEZI|nr:hypothetical protein B0A48_12273 [Cryoendolithus antarcticus]